ncbi:MAG: HEAT repeat domain-containing protein [Planctomycetota bacterium]
MNDSEPPAPPEAASPPGSGQAETFELGGPSAPAGGGGGRQSWLGPLILVPAGLVLAAVALYLFMNWMVGNGGKGPEELIQEIASGGYNVRKQAFYELMATLADLSQSGELDRLPADFDDQAARAFDALPAAEALPRVALGYALTAVRSPLAYDRLVTLVRDARQAGGGVAAETPLESLGVVENRHLDPLTTGLWCLGQLGDARAVPILAETLSSQDPGVREMAAASLAAIPSPAAVPPLRRALLDADADTRRNAAVGLARHGDPGGREVLLSMLELGNYSDYKDLEYRTQAVQAALRALAALRLSDARLLVEALSEDEAATPGEKGAALAWLESESRGWAGQ